MWYGVETRRGRNPGSKPGPDPEILYWKLKSFLTIVYLKRDLRQTCHVDKRAFVPEIKIVSDNRLSEKRPAANVPRRQTSICTGELRIVYLKRDLRQTCHVDGHGPGPRPGASEAATAAMWRPRPGAPRKRRPRRRGRSRLGSGDRPATLMFELATFRIVAP